MAICLHLQEGKAHAVTVSALADGNVSDEGSSSSVVVQQPVLAIPYSQLSIGA